MNANILRALVRDAFYQVLDNWVFRILTGLTLLPILVTFVVGFREEGVVLLFGWKSWSYAELLDSMGGGGAALTDPQGMAIETLVQLFFDNVAGGFGILLAIAATAFFVPRLLEKGAADLYFHTPVSRPVLYLSRYLAGLLFIAISASVLVLGIFLGLAVSSQHVDPGVLLAAPTLVYVFALVFPFTMLVGVVTRSTVASILLSGMFFLFNGCIQKSWIAWEQGLRGPSLKLAVGQSAEEDDSSEDSAPEVEQETPAFLRAMRTTLDVVRTVLPKTTDADTIARKLRRSVNAPLFRDETEFVAVFRLPGELERIDPPRAEGALPEPILPVLGELRFQAERDEQTRYSLWSRPIEHTTSKIGDKERVREETLSRAGERLEDALTPLAGVTGVARKSARLPRDLPSSQVTWTIEREGQRSTCCAHVFKGSEGELLFTLVTVVAGEPDEAALEAEVERLAKQVGLDRGAIDEWYPSQLSFDAPWRTNLIFSVGSSLLFAAAILALGLWRLARIAF